MNTKDIEEIVWKILERTFPKGYDIDAKLVEDLRVILTQHHEAEVERAKMEARKEERARWIQPLLDDVISITVEAKAHGRVLATRKIVSVREAFLSDGRAPSGLAEIAINEILQALTPTKTDKTTEV